MGAGPLGCFLNAAALVAEIPNTAALVADAYLHTERIALGLCLLSKQLLRHPTAERLLIKESELLVACGKISDAAAVATTAVDVASTSTAAWLALARAHVAAKEFERALVALNAAPMTIRPIFGMTPMPRPATAFNIDSVFVRSMVAEHDVRAPAWSCPRCRGPRLH